MSNSADLSPDIDVTQRAIDRLVNSLTGDPQEQATIAATAAFCFISLAHGDDLATEAFARAAGLEKTS